MSYSTICALMLFSMVSQACGNHIRIEFGNFEDITCYTCQGKQNNADCNAWAPNIPCPLKHTVCKTIHLIDLNTGTSIEVNKMCALPEQCSLEEIGCEENQDGDMICTSCCNKSFCNVAVPTNETTSIQLSEDLIGSSAGHMISNQWETFLLLLVVWFELYITRIL